MRDINKHIGDRIKYFRKNNKYTITQIASAIDFTPTSMSRVEKGLQPISIDKLQKLCSIFLCEYSDILPGIPKAEIKKVTEEQICKITKQKLIVNYGK